MDCQQLRSKLLRSSTSLDVSTEPDRISELPDDMLIQILDKLRIDEAINTSFLSKRWKNLWRHKRRIEIGCARTPGSKKTDKKVLPKLLKVLDASQVKSMESIAVSFWYDCSMLSDIQFLLAFASLNVKELYVDFKDKNVNWIKKRRKYPLVLLPEDDVQPCPSLVKLSLRSMNLDTLPRLRFKGLEQLFLDQVALNADSVESITGSCPSLTLLSLTNCNPTSNLWILLSSNSNLLHLVVKEEFAQIKSKTIVYIKGDGLKSIVFLLALPRRSYIVAGIHDRSCSATFMLEQMEDSPQAVRLYATGLKGNSIANFTGLLNDLVTVKKITLSSWCIQALTAEVRQLKRPPLFDATHLVLQTGLSRMEFLGICYMLLGCCKIKTLVIDMRAPSELNVNFREGENPVGDLEPFDNILQDLAVVEFRHYSGTYTWDDRSFLEAPFFSGFDYGRLLLWNLKKFARNLKRISFSTEKQVYETDEIQRFGNLDSGSQLDMWELPYVYECPWYQRGTLLRYGLERRPYRFNYPDHPGRLYCYG